MYHLGAFPKTRMRRLRKNASIRSLTKETRFDLGQMVLPIFIRHGEGIKQAIPAMPGHFQWSLDRLPEEIQTISQLGIKQVLLFGIPQHKDAYGSDAYSSDGIIQNAICIIKKTDPNLLVISDICFCEYTDHGHCGMLRFENDAHPDVDNDQTLLLLAKQAVSHAKAGADIIAPSANMDGMVRAIRQVLDEAGYEHLPILSYAAKYASSMYGPFRLAAEGAPQLGNRKTYQMDIANALEAVRECGLDIAEGADILMVKPAHTYLDVIYRVKEAYPAMPLAAYHTSGEFAMIKAASKEGWMNEQQSVFEILTAIYRAGADFVITYYAKEIAMWLTSKK